MVCIVRNAGVQSSGPWWWCRLSSHHVLPEQMLSSAVWCSWSTGFQWLSMWDHLQRWRFFVLISMSPLRSLEGISPCREATLPARQDPKVWGVILDGYWNQKISVFFADIWRYLNLLSWTTQAMSPGHFTHASLYLCFVMPLKLTESHFCRCLRKAWVEKRRTKIQGERSSTRSHTCRTPAAPGSHETCRRFDWILLGFSNWHVLGMMIPYDTLCTNWLCNSKILCHCAVAKIDKKYKESCVWFGWFSLAFCDCDRFLGLQRCVLWRLWGDGVNSEGSDMYKTPMEFFQGQVTVQIPRFQQTGSQRTWSVLEANNAADAPPVLRLRLPNAWDFLSPTYRKLRWEEATYLNNQKCLDVSLNFSESEVH